MTTVEQTQPITPSPEGAPQEGLFIYKLANINRSGFYIDVSNDIKRVIVHKDGRDIEAEEVLRLYCADQSVCFSVLRKVAGNGYTVQRRQNSGADEQVEDAYIPFNKSGYAELRIPNSSSRVVLGINRKQEVIKLYCYRNSGDNTEPEVILISGQQERSQKDLGKSFDRMRDAEERAKRRKNRFLALGFLAFFSSRGPVDQVLDAVIDQPAAAATAVADRRVAPNNISDDNQGLNAELDRVEATLRTTLHDLDVENYEAINDRAAEFRNSYPEGTFFSVEQSTELKEDIDNASGFAELQATLNPFLERYHIILNIGEDNEGVTDGSLELAKQYADGIVDVLNIFPSYGGHENNYMPYGFQELFGLRHISLRSDMGNMVGGVQSSSNIDLNIGNEYHLISSVLPADESALGTSSPEPIGMFAHELGHAANLNSLSINHSQGFDYKKAVGAVFGGIFNYRVVNSVYALTHPEENRAEQFREFLTVGIEDPNNSLAFESPLNGDLLKMLASYEDIMPGFADQLVSQTTMKHTNESGMPQVEGFYHNVALFLVCLSLFANRERVSYKNLQRTAQLNK